ncbi:hypothetical protein VTO73DRAFT_2135 [Trametes versicolor]
MISHQSSQEADRANSSPVPNTSPVSASGQVLGSPELLSAILDVLNPGRSTEDDTDEEFDLRTTNKAALAACARVSRHFSQHALDVLWFSLDENILTLLRILPSTRSYRGPGWYGMIITGDITPAEWARFCSYAVRVREISYSPPGVDPLIWTILARICQGEPLFPRLRLIVAWDVTEHDVPALVSLLSPSLRNFSLQAAGPLNPKSASQLCAGLMELFQTLVDIAPDLDELDWSVPCNWRFDIARETAPGQYQAAMPLQWPGVHHWHTRESRPVEAPELAARACKAFVEPALDALWRELGDLLVLLRILPSLKPYTPQSMNILAEITPTQWRRFHSYARRVRSLLANALEPSVKHVDKIVWVILGSHLNGQPLLPKLRELSLVEFTPDYLALLVLLSSSLYALDLDLSPLARGILLQLLMPHCRQLSQFTIRSGLEDMPPHMLSSITGLEKLRELDLVYSEAIADFGTLQAISKMADLRDLTLRFSLDPPDPAKLPALGGAFSKLSRLHLSGDIHDLRDVFEACDCARLTALTLTVSEATTVQDLQGGFEVICAHVPKSLQEARIYMSGGVYWNGTPKSVSDIVQPFFVFRGLRHATIEFHQDPHVDDRDACAFATAWPYLTHFELTYADWDLDKEVTHLTVAGLIEFVQRCPRLCHLEVPFLDIRGPLPSLHTLPPMGLKSLRRLDFSELLGGREGDLLGLAVVLDMLFPSAGRLNYVTVKETILGEILAANEMYQPTQVTMLLQGAMWARRQGEMKAARERALRAMMEADESTDSEGYSD